MEQGKKGPSIILDKYHHLSVVGNGPTEKEVEAILGEMIDRGVLMSLEQALQSTTLVAKAKAIFEVREQKRLKEAEEKARKEAEEALRQCRLHARHLREERTGCFRHDADPSTGLRSAGLWARGNGWAIMGLAETLSGCPPGSAGYAEVLETHRALAEGLLRLRHTSGLWRVVPDDPESHLETSGTAMILLGLLAGVTRGWLEESLLAPIASSFGALLTSVVPDGPARGALMGSQRPAGPGGWERHRVAEIGECAYATGCFLKLVARLVEAGLLTARDAADAGAGKGAEK